jgi:ketosteroid isomerase-like protein
MQEDRRHQLEELTLRFTEAFNRDDLDEVMGFFTEDAIYDEFNGRQNRGKAAIREAFAPQFRGDFGTIRFVVEDVMVDSSTGMALVRWLCTLEVGGRPSGWRGLDVLRFDGRLVCEKHTYAKASVPLLDGAATRPS